MIPTDTNYEWEDDGREPGSIKQIRRDRRITMVMAAIPVRPHHPIYDWNGDKYDDVSRPAFGQKGKEPHGKQGKQDRPDTTQQCMFVEQENPEQKRRHEAEAVEPLNIDL